jgi:tRNA-dihydrouridine synthase B
MLLDWKPERIAVREMRKHIAWYLHGLRGAAQMRVKINTIETPEEAEQALREYQITCSMQES